jgi:hypothetical protein
MLLTADQNQTESIGQILAIELEYGELACGPNFLLDIKLFSHTSKPKAVLGVYKLVKSIYDETPLEEAHLESLLSTIDRDEHSESWNAKDNISELTTESFGEWFKGCCLAEDYFTDEETGEIKAEICKCHQNAIVQLTEYIQSLLFPENEPAKLYSLTDSNNENTPYSVYVAIGKTHTLLVVSHWVL